MSNIRSMQRISLRLLAKQSLTSSPCIRHRPNIPVRLLHSRSKHTLSPLLPLLFRLYQQNSQQRGYATTTHNQKYSDDKVPLTLDITPSCAQVFPVTTQLKTKQLSKIHARENNPNLMLRVTVESGGCHGYQYLMSLTESYDPEEDAYFSRIIWLT